MKNTLLLFLFLLSYGLQAQSVHWAHSIGGVYEESAQAIASDDAGNNVTVGNFSAIVDFDPEGGYLNLQAASPAECFISKLDPFGSLLWVRVLTSDSSITPLNVTIDAQHRTTVVGTFRGQVDFDPGITSHVLQSQGLTDAFILQLDEAGQFLWAHRFGGTGNDAWKDVATTSDGLVAVGSFTGNASGDGSSSPSLTSGSGTQSAMVVHYNTAGTLDWAKKTTAENAIANAVCVDQNGFLYIGLNYSGSLYYDISQQIVTGMSR